MPITGQSISADPRQSCNIWDDPYSFEDSRSNRNWHIRCSDLFAYYQICKEYLTNMSRYIWKSVLLLTLSIVICYGLYPLSSWVIGKAAFSSQPNSSMLGGHDSRIVDSRQIAEPTPKDEYFQPRPAAASYDASGSTSPAMAASKNFGPQNRDFGVTEGPMLQRPAQKVCHFYDC